MSIGDTGKSAIVDGCFGITDEVGGQSNTFVIGAVGGRFIAETVADGINMLGGGLEEFVNGNAGGFEFDFGVFEAII